VGVGKKREEPREFKLDNNNLLGEVGPEGGLEAGNGARRGGGEKE
jgi:hypothetical protein